MKKNEKIKELKTFLKDVPDESKFFSYIENERNLLINFYDKKMVLLNSIKFSLKFKKEKLKILFSLLHDNLEEIKGDS